MNEDIRSTEAALRAFAGHLDERYRGVCSALAPRLTDAELVALGQEALKLANHSLRSWEAGDEFLRAAPEVLELRSFDALLAWGQRGRELADYSSAMARSYFEAGPQVLRRLDDREVEEWGRLGITLYRGTWKSISLVSQFYAGSATLLEHLTLGELRALVRSISDLADRSYDLALACLDLAPRTLAEAERADRGALIEFVSVIVEHSWADARVYLEHGPALIKDIDPAARGQYLRLIASAATTLQRQTYARFAEGADALAQMAPESHSVVVGQAEALAVRSPSAAMAYLKSVPSVLARVTPEGLDAWYERGGDHLDVTVEGGESFFRLESSLGEEVLDGLSPRVELDRVADILRMYCKALTGDDVVIAPSSGLAERHIGWISSDMPSTEGGSIYLPEAIRQYPDRERNFGLYKVFATHQAGHLEFDSFSFQYDRPGAVFGCGGRDRLEATPAPEGRQPLTEMERFFDLFQDRQLASDLFAIAEDSRVDACILREYSGIRAALREVQEAEIAGRETPESMPLREALVELLLRLSLDPEAELRWPGQLSDVLRRAAAVLLRVRGEPAVVEDAAEATIALYELVTSLPNRTPEEEGVEPKDWQTFPQPGEGQMDLPAGEEPSGQQGGTPGPMEGGEEAAEENRPYTSPRQVAFRGEFKPELVQLLQRLRQGGPQDAADGTTMPVTQEQLQEMLEKSVEITLTDADDADSGSPAGMFVENMLKETEGAPQKSRKPSDGADGDVSAAEDDTPLAEERRYFYYDEWDFRAGDYKPRWCRVIEQKLEEGTTSFYNSTLIERAGLINQTRKQFELMRPELFRKIKRLPDGEEFDLDAAIEYIADRRAGHTPEDKLYWRRNKIERDVAVAFLLDMSASTDEEIDKHRPGRPADNLDDDPRRYLAWWATRSPGLTKPPKRIIDVEKESIVLLIRALEAIGDTYGIYGFSGYGRDNVEFYVIKDLKESFGELIQRRIEKIAPIRSTRMGPAIRHTTTKLLENDARVKILFLVSDGRPQDHGYGRDRTEKEYAIRDTKMALTEARRHGITPFALTVDRNGHDYLKQMCDDMGYEVLADVEALPRRLPMLYRMITE